MKMLCNIIKRLLKMSEKTQLTTFNEIIEVVLEHEGGYVNDPNDLGGETNFGGLDFSSNEPNDITLSLRFDYAILQF